VVQKMFSDVSDELVASTFRAGNNAIVENVVLA
jgi:hypothetical protein